MDSINQRFSDLLSDRYKDLLKKDQSVTPEKQEPPDSDDSGSSSPDSVLPPGLSPASSTQKSAPAPQEGDCLEDKLRRFKELLSNSNSYPSNQDLRLKLGFDDADFKALKDYKYKLMLDPDANIYERVSLQGEGGKNLFYRKTYAYNTFTDMFNMYIEKRDHFKADHFIDDMLFNLIFAETQNTFDLESESNPQKLIESIINKKTPLSASEQLLCNIYSAYAFIIENEISEENLFSLRKILTQNLDVREVRRYRTEELYIDGNMGDVAIHAVSPASIDLAMKKLFTYIDFSMSNANQSDAFISSLIIHYYFIYVSPYFEHNFTLARLVSAWYVIRHPDIVYKPLFLSEALNRDRHTGKYIKALKDSFDAGGDLTFFINYLSDILSSYSLAYIYLAKIIDYALSMSISLSRSEERAIKVILLFPNIGERYFDWQKFKSYDGTGFSKQYYNRLLNHLEQKKILTSVTRGAKLYRLNYELFPL